MLCHNAFAQVGSSCSNPYIIYPATTCSNNCGAQYCGNMECPTGDCGAYVTMAGTSGGLNPSCTLDNETTENVMWMAVTATASSFTINNGSPYVGAGAANANKKDYIVYSGTCGSLTQIGCYTIAANGTAVQTGLTPGQVYYIMASPASTNTTANAINVCITSTVGYAAPGNTCASAISLATNSSGIYTNAGATANGPICSGSVENDVWYSWCAPSNWPAGQQAYISVSNQVCNSPQGLQLSVWNTNTTCPSSAASANVVCQNPGTTTQYYFQWTAIANQCYLITLDGFAGTACQYRLAVGSVVILPIELLSFEGKQRGSVVDLLWSTASELNNDYFTLEKSRGDGNFIPFGRVEGAGNSSSLIRYSYTDDSPDAGINYYRLKQTDQDGRFSYSDIVAVNFTGGKHDLYTVYNPVSNEIEVVHDSPENCKSILRIFDMTSREIYSEEVETHQGNNRYSIHSFPFSKGIYCVTLENDFSALKSRFVAR